MRSTVQDVLESLASGMTEDEIPADFSELPREDIQVCLSYDFYNQPARTGDAVSLSGRLTVEIVSFAADRERKLFTAVA